MMVGAGHTCFAGCLVSVCANLCRPPKACQCSWRCNRAKQSKAMHIYCCMLVHVRCGLTHFRRVPAAGDRHGLCAGRRLVSVQLLVM